MEYSTENHIEDVGTETPDSPSIYTLVDQGILSLDRDQLFYPNKPISKIEALTGIMRASDMMNHSSSGQKDVPYWDVPARHWSVPYLKSALSHGVIMPGHHFYPKRDITKSEMWAILSRTPRIQRMFEATFQ